MSASNFTRLPIVLLQFGQPLQTNIYFHSVVDRAVILLRKRGEVLDISEVSELTRGGVKLLARAWEIEKALKELGAPEAEPSLPELETVVDSIDWQG